MGDEMDLSRRMRAGLVLLGCGKMGSALLKGWLARGLQPGAVHVIEPRPSDWLQGTGVR
jgi:pyrroline-5-carboxylate reductase